MWFAKGKCVREHLQVQVNTFSYGKCVREHLQVQVNTFFINYNIKKLNMMNSSKTNLYHNKQPSLLKVP